MTYDDFSKIDLRVGRIMSATRIEGSDKLLRLEVDMGTTDKTCPPQTRQIIAGLGKTYEPEDIAGKEVVVVANLEPKEIMGHESQGMILAATNEDGLPIILTLEQSVDPGSEVR